MGHAPQAEMTMLLHVDEASDHQAATSLLRRLVRTDGASVNVLAVGAESDPLAAEAAQALQPHFGEVKRESRTGQPSTQVLQLAQEIEADLIVLGAGQPMREVLERSATPVLIARPPAPQCASPTEPSGRTQPFRILVATDGSPCAVAAVGTLSDLRPPTDAEIVVLSVIERSRPFFTPRVPPTCQAELRRSLREIKEEEDQSAQAALERTRASLTAPSAQVRWITREGNPAVEVARAAEEMEADLIVMGSRGLSWVKRLFAGSVSRQVADSVACSVLLVRPMPEAASGPQPGN